MRVRRTCASRIAEGRTGAATVGGGSCRLDGSHSERVAQDMMPPRFSVAQPLISSRRTERGDLWFGGDGHAVAEPCEPCGEPPDLAKRVNTRSILGAHFVVDLAGHAAETDYFEQLMHYRHQGLLCY